MTATSERPPRNWASLKEPFTVRLPTTDSDRTSPKPDIQVKKIFFAILLAIGTLTACYPVYKLNGASIDYAVTKTISFENFPIKAALVYAPLAVNFNDALQDKYASQTRLSQVRQDGDLQLSGAITGYTLTPQAVKSDAYAAETRLTIKIKVKFVNKNNSTENFEKEFSAYRDFDATQLLTDVQDGLCEEMVKELVEEIFNATVANW
ncbi:MAG: LptE family protein [Bacteroidales bacterium]|nr:LptE family protein [Bacteroidales bacterium]MBP5213984.1 LptE family protein [Bacteroidales bacterium]MBP5764355.1 LptE family protein [Bacteroidales bacterium]